MCVYVRASQFFSICLIVMTKLSYGAARACRFVDVLVEDVPYSPNLELMKKYQIDYVIHGDDIAVDANGKNAYEEIINAGLFKYCFLFPLLLFISLCLYFAVIRFTFFLEYKALRPVHTFLHIVCFYSIPSSTYRPLITISLPHRHIIPSSYYRPARAEWSRARRA